MCTKLFLATAVLLALALAGRVSAMCANLLASYEPDEVNDLRVRPNPVFSPSLHVDWPVRGGVNDIPEATDGDYVLKLYWEAEPDRKVEVRHDWNDTRFDLAGVDYMLVDVYFPTESALPACHKDNVSIWSLWDSDECWFSSDCVPTTTREWHTVLLNVSRFNYRDCNSITALIFEEMGNPGDTAGCIYIDNLRLGSSEDVIRKQISFAGYNWLVKDSGCSKHGPGPDYFSDSKESVWVDGNDHLHLKIANRCDKWFCSEVILDGSPGYGKYIFSVEGRVDLFDPNIVLGLFTWDTDAPNHHYREIDIELSKWWRADEPNDAQYVVQPWCADGHRHRFDINLAGYAHETTTHQFTWRPDEICFQSYHGQDPNEAIEVWRYDRNGVPPAGGENARINFWLLPPEDDPWGTPKPADGNEAEIVVKKFRYVPLPNLETCWDAGECEGQPFGDANCDGCVNFLDLGMLKNCFLCVQCDPCYDCCADFNHDEQVDFIDLGILKANLFNCGYSPSMGNQNCPP
jgi:hypothetical protein